MESSFGIPHAHTWGLVIPLLTILFSPYILSTYAVLDGVPQSLNAVLAGIIVACVTYVLMSQFPVLVTHDNVLAKAVLCGLLVAEIMVLKPYKHHLPSMSTITLFLFFYYHTTEHV